MKLIQVITLLILEATLILNIFSYKLEKSKLGKYQIILNALLLISYFLYCTKFAN